MYHLINYRKLPRPSSVVQKLPQVESIVIGGVSLGVVCGSDGRHLVAIDGVEVEEAFYFGGDFARWEFVPGHDQFLEPASENKIVRAIGGNESRF